ncbi:transposase [Streptosporangium canum]
MTARLPCPVAPGPLEDYAARFDDVFSALGQRRGFREYLAGLLLPRERNKTLTCLAGAEPVIGINDPAVQRLQYFLSESVWDPEAVNDRRVALLLADPATAPTGPAWSAAFATATMKPGGRLMPGSVRGALIGPTG